MSRSIEIIELDDGIIQLLLDNPNGSSNLMNRAFTEDLVETVKELSQREFKGLIISSAKSTFFAGGDLTELIHVSKDTAQETFDNIQELKGALRWIETCGRPVVACINGAALGGGWELALHCHHRIALGNSIPLGLPEVSLGLLPGGGGVIRMSRLLGLQGALPYLVQGKQFKSAEAAKLGLVHNLVDTPEQLIEEAMSWIKSQQLPVAQPFDEAGYRVPGGLPSSSAVAQLLPIAPAMIRSQTHGVLPAPEAILSVMVEGLQVDVETADRIESRYFVGLASGQVSKNMINTFWFELNAIKAGASRPPEVAKTQFKKVGVLGAGMMGAAIAYTLAYKGIQVVLKDVSEDVALKGKSYGEKRLAKRVEGGRMSAIAMNEILDRITATGDANDLKGCELVIEAVPEDRELKARVTQEALAALGNNAIFASNTSTLPISGLATASNRPDQFIGLHFFSPADKMPLVEIIRGDKTSDDTLAKSYDLVQQIGKTPIVVRDSRGFFTSRVFGTYTNEGMKLLAEGVPAAMIENAAYEAGFPIGPLAVLDEVSLNLVDKVRSQTIKDLKAVGESYQRNSGDDVVDRMLSVGRGGRLAGKGFYDYDTETKSKHIAAEVDQLFETEVDYPFEDVKRRLLYRQVIESIKTLDEGVVSSVRDANIGSIMGIGFPAWTGGVLQFINSEGLRQFSERAGVLRERYGDDFQVPESLIHRIIKGEEYHDET